MAHEKTNNRQASIIQKLGYALRLTIFYPAFLLSIGNIFLAISTDNPFGIMFQFGATSVIFYKCIKAFKGGTQPALPYVILGLVNIASAGIGLIDGLLLSANQDSFHTIILGNLALAG